MHSTPDADATQIVFIGRKNTGKSSLINAFFGQEVSTVDDNPGTTTQPFYNLLEMMPYGPVLLVDTAGIDDNSDLNEKNLTKILRSISSADLAVIILDARYPLTNQEIELFFYLDKVTIPYLVAVNKIEFGVCTELLKDLMNLKVVHYEISCKENVGIDELKLKVMRKLPRETSRPLLSDIVSAGSLVVYVLPEDISIPGSKCALFQINHIKELISEDSICIVVKEREIKSALSALNKNPDLIVTDSSILKKVIDEVPEKIAVTTFSVLLGRQKGDLKVYSRGLKRLDELNDGDKILIAEACNYHNPRNDSGLILFPQWVRNRTKKHVLFDTVIGGALPDNLGEYKLIIHCNGCMISRKEMQIRLNESALLDVPVISYGLLAAFIAGGYPKVVLPFN